jgi:ubiquinone biosynthesis O-methyltransferase
MIRDRKDCQEKQRVIFNKSFANGPFVGVVAELSYKKRIDFSLRFIPTGGIVLDFGCGDGHVTKGILQKAKKVTAIDISESAIEVAKEFNNHPDITYLNIALEDFNSNEKFDSVMMFEILEHVFDSEAVLKKVWGLLKDKGTLILSTPNFLRLTRRMKQLYGVRQIRKKMGKDSKRIGCDHIHEFTYSELKNMLNRCGFEILDYEGLILLNDTVGGHLLRSVYWVQRLNFYLGRLFPSVSGHFFIAAQKI